MNDRKLLEFAAKACGYEYGYINDVFKVKEDHEFGSCGTYGCTKHNLHNWNPLTDDGDALRLAVRLDLLGSDFDYENTVAQAQKDSLSATRRAIVRAAAEIGRLTP